MIIAEVSIEPIHKGNLNFHANGVSESIHLLLDFLSQQSATAVISLRGLDGESICLVKKEDQFQEIGID